MAILKFKSILIAHELQTIDHYHNEVNNKQQCRYCSTGSTELEKKRMGRSHKYFIQDNEKCLPSCTA